MTVWELWEWTKVQWLHGCWLITVHRMIRVFALLCALSNLLPTAWIFIYALSISQASAFYNQEIFVVRVILFSDQVRFISHLFGLVRQALAGFLVAHTYVLYSYIQQVSFAFVAFRCWMSAAKLICLPEWYLCAQYEISRRQCCPKNLARSIFCLTVLLQWTLQSLAQEMHEFSRINDVTPSCVYQVESDQPVIVMVYTLTYFNAVQRAII